jgi:hypothetical protein
MQKPPPSDFRQTISAIVASHQKGITIAEILMIAGLCISVLATDINRIHDRVTGDFEHFYYAAEAIHNGTDPYASGSRGYIYPPLIAFLFEPLAQLGRDRAAAWMLGINVFTASLAIILAADQFLRRFGISRNPMILAAVILLSMLLNIDKIKGEWQMWQTDVFMLLLFVVALRWLDRFPICAGIALGMAVNIKYLPLMFIPYLLIRRRWRTTAGLIIGTLIFAILPALATGWTANLRNLHTAMTGLLQMTGMQTGGIEAAHIHHVKDALSCSITSALVRATSPGTGFLIAALIAGAIVTAAAWIYRQNQLSLFDPQLANNPAITAAEWVMLIAGVLAFSPQTNTRHLFDALIFTSAASVLLLFPRPSVSSIPLLVGTAIQFLGFILPFGNRTVIGEHTPTLVWLRMGGPCWCLLVGAFALLWTVVCASNATRTPLQEYTPSRG